MVLRRMIPVILLKNNGMIISHNFKNYKYVGDPVNAIRIFNEKEADEVVVLDIMASKEGREPNYNLLERIAQEAFMPLTYGGGINNIEQIGKILYMGYEKVSINSHLFKNYNFIDNIILEFGSSSIVGCIDVKRNLFNSPKVYNHVQGKSLNIDPVEYSKKIVGSGVGELIVNSVDMDGMRKGYDLGLIQSVSSWSNVSTVCLGGAGTYQDIRDALCLGIDGAAAGSLFSLYGKHRAVLITYNRSEVESLLENV